MPRESKATRQKIEELVAETAEKQKVRAADEEAAMEKSRRIVKAANAKFQAERDEAARKKAEAEAAKKKEERRKEQRALLLQKMRANNIEEQYEDLYCLCPKCSILNRTIRARCNQCDADLD